MSQLLSYTYQLSGLVDSPVHGEHSTFPVNERGKLCRLKVVVRNSREISRAVFFIDHVVTTAGCPLYRSMGVTQPWVYGRDNLHYASLLVV